MHDVMEDDRLSVTEKYVAVNCIWSMRSQLKRKTSPSKLPTYQQIDALLTWPRDLLSTEACVNLNILAQEVSEDRVYLAIEELPLHRQPTMERTLTL